MLMVEMMMTRRRWRMHNVYQNLEEFEYRLTEMMTILTVTEKSALLRDTTFTELENYVNLNRYDLF